MREANMGVHSVNSQNATSSLGSQLPILRTDIRQFLTQMMERA